MREYATALIQRNRYYLFDSHIREGRELSVAEGNSMLLRFGSSLEIEHYIQVAYLEYRDLEQCYFHVHFLYLNVKHFFLLLKAYPKFDSSVTIGQY